MSGIREVAPDLWRGIVGWCREIGIDWPEDDIASVVSKVRAETPDDLPDLIGMTLAWCREAERIGGDTEEMATVDLWRNPDLPIQIVRGEDGGLAHRIDPDVTVEIDQDGGGGEQE